MSVLSPDEEIDELTQAEAGAWFVSANPETYLWDDAFRAGSVEWTGARSPLAQKNIRRCRPGDPVIAYRSGDDQLIVGLGRIEGKPVGYEEGGRHWTKVRIRMDRAPFALPVPLERIREVCPAMAHFHTPRASFTVVLREEWEQLQPIFDGAVRSGAVPLPGIDMSELREPTGEMIITTLGSEDIESWNRLVREKEVLWRFGPRANAGDHVLMYVPKGLTKVLASNEPSGLRFLFRTAMDSHEPSPLSRWRQEAMLTGKTELTIPVSLEMLRADPIAGQWAPIRMNFQRLGQESSPVPPKVRRAIWRLIEAANPGTLVSLSQKSRTNVEASNPFDSSVEEPSSSDSPPAPDAPSANQSPNPAPESPILKRQDITAYTTGPARYSPEFCGVGGNHPVLDDLGVEALAHRLAEQLALRETKLPLAIGLFGNWGSGKSHFMNLMDRHMRKLTNRTPRNLGDAAAHSGQANEGHWCGEIVPVYFNAWHYLDANLWASLVSQIFESLFAHLRPKIDELETVQRLLENASGATALAAAEVKQAEVATKRAQEDLFAATASKQAQETMIEGLLHALKSLLPEAKPEDLQKRAAELLGVEKEIKTIDDLRETVRDVRSFGRLKLLYNSVWKQPGGKWKLGCLVGMAAGAALLAVGATYLPAFRDLLSDQWEQICRLVGGTLTGVGTLLGLVQPLIARAKTGLNQLETWAERAQQEQEKMGANPAILGARLEVAHATAKEAEARSRLFETEAREKQLREQAANLTPERRLGRFIEDRAQSADYRGQLGLVSLARRDFQELSNLFADQEALDEKLAALEESGDPEKQKDAQKITKLSRSVDRIVLFVDDLDRCQPDKVVDVLQAVHLLLAYPLFAVVVGVDQRCLRQSLRIQFSGLLTPENSAEAKDQPAKEEPEHPATPLDYLEKIFHIPFHLPPMDEAGYKALIESLTKPVSVPAEKKTQAGAPPPKDVEATDSAPTTPPNAPAATREESAKARPPATPPGTENEPSTKIAETGEQAQQSPPPAPPPVRVLGSVPLEDWECEMLKEYHTLIGTPRATKRLLNTYRLVRAGIPESEWGLFCGEVDRDGEYRLCMYLLALAAGHPALVRDWFRVLRQLPPDLSLPTASFADAPSARWDVFNSSYETMLQSVVPRPTQSTMVKWLDRVERFSF